MSTHETFEPRTINLLEETPDDLDANVLASLREVRGRLLALEVEAARLEGQLRMAGQERINADREIEDRIDALTAQYGDLRETFRAKIVGINNYRRSLGQTEIAMSEPDDVEIHQAMRSENA